MTSSSHPVEARLNAPVQADAGRVGLASFERQDVLRPPLCRTRSRDLCLSLLITSVALAWATGCAPAQPASNPPEGLAQTALAAFAWDALAAPGFTTYSRPGSYAHAHADELHARTGDALHHALDLLGETTYPAHLRVFYVGSRDEMVPLTGGRYTGFADAPGHVVALVENETWRAFTRHEVMHAVSLLLWGHPGGAEDAPRDSVAVRAWRRGGWLREGIAAAAEDRCGPYTNRGVAATMEQEGALLPLALLMGAFYEQDDLAAYLQAGSLVGYLLDTYGRETFRTLWESNSVEDAYGMSVAAVEAAWVAWLRATPSEARPERMGALRACGFVR